MLLTGPRKFLTTGGCWGHEHPAVDALAQGYSLRGGRATAASTRVVRARAADRPRGRGAALDDQRALRRARRLFERGRARDAPVAHARLARLAARRGARGLARVHPAPRERRGSRGLRLAHADVLRDGRKRDRGRAARRGRRTDRLRREDGRRLHVGQRARRLLVGVDLLVRGHRDVHGHRDRRLVPDPGGDLMRGRLAAAGFGALFGFLISWGQFTDPDRIRAMLLLEDAYLYLMMYSAIAVAGTGTWLLHRRRARALLTGERITVERTKPERRHFVGAAIFGVGWAVG